MFRPKSIPVLVIASLSRTPSFSPSAVNGAATLARRTVRREAPPEAISARISRQARHDLGRTGANAIGAVLARRTTPGHQSAPLAAQSVRVRHPAIAVMAPRQRSVNHSGNRDRAGRLTPGIAGITRSAAGAQAGWTIPSQQVGGDLPGRRSPATRCPVLGDARPRSPTTRLAENRPEAIRLGGDGCRSPTCNPGLGSIDEGWGTRKGNTTLTLLARHWWMIALRGLVAILFGVVACFGRTSP